MASLQDKYTTTAAVDGVRAAYGNDDDAVVTQHCLRCGGTGSISYFHYHDAGVCYGCNGTGGHYSTTVGRLVAKAKRQDSAAATKARKAGAARDARDAWLADNAKLVARAEAVGVHWADDWRKVPTDAQVAAYTKVVQERELKAQLDELRKASAEVVPTGKTTVTGAITSAKYVRNHFSYSGGDVLKVVVEDQRGFRVFGTCPAAVADAVLADFYKDRDAGLDGEEVWFRHLIGQQVTFTATLEQAKDDPTFGFFKRPTSAKWLDAAEAE